MLPGAFAAHPDLLFQLVTQLSPRLLRQHGVPVYSATQVGVGGGGRVGGWVRGERLCMLSWHVGLRVLASTPSFGPHPLAQEEGQFIITFPGAYHGGFNCGINCAEVRCARCALCMLRGRSGIPCFQMPAPPQSRMFFWACKRPSFPLPWAPQAVNMAPADWLRFGASSLARYRKFKKPCVISHEEMLLKVKVCGIWCGFWFFRGVLLTAM